MTAPPAVRELVDPHIHLWDVHDNPYRPRPLVRLLGWNRRALELVAKLAFPRDLLAFFGQRNHALEDYLLPEYWADARATGVTRFVHVQAGWKDKRPMDPVGETRWLEGLRQSAGPLGPAGIVAYADLRLGASVDAVLKAHLAASPAVRGVRYMLTWHPHRLVHSFAPAPALTRDPSWRAGFEALVRNNLSFDAWVYHHQLPELAALARDYPEARIVLCHVGTPVGLGGPFHGLGENQAARDQIRDDWRRGLAELAESPNVYCKLSGVTMPVVGFGYHQRERKPGAEELARALSPILRVAIERFGVERCMFASNFPVDKVSVELDTLWDAHYRVMDELELDAEARARLLRDTAIECYRLDAQT